jgi:protein-tyrosine phosphatase
VIPANGKPGNGGAACGNDAASTPLTRKQTLPMRAGVVPGLWWRSTSAAAVLRKDALNRSSAVLRPNGQNLQNEGRETPICVLPLVIELQTHILPGLDDGSRTLEERVEMARSAVADGICVVAATPHVRDAYPTRAAEMERAVDDLREALANEGLRLDVRTGGEIALDRLGTLDSDELTRFGLAGNSGYLLVEFPYYGWPLDIGMRVLELSERGITAILAHPERNAEVQAAPDRVRPLVEEGVLVQVTAASLDGRLGRATQRTAFRLLELGLVHLVASDAHAPDVRAVGMTAAVGAVRDATLARWLSVDVPAAIVANEPLLARPPSTRKRPGWLSRT